MHGENYMILHKNRIIIFLITGAAIIPSNCRSSKPIDLDTELYSGFADSTISSANVNMREKPDLNSGVVTLLNRGQAVDVKEIADKTLFIDKYFGAWLKVETADKKEGYVLSCFVQSPQNKIEPFHVFFEKFKGSWQNKNMEGISPHVKFPLELILMEEGAASSEKLQSDDFFSRTTISEPFMYGMTFEKESASTLLVQYGYEAQQYTLHFSVINGIWILVKIRISTC